MQKSKRYYTVYSNKTDEIVASGDSRTCAQMLGITLESFYSFVTNTRTGRTKSFTVISDSDQIDEPDEDID